MAVDRQVAVARDRDALRQLRSQRRHVRRRRERLGGPDVVGVAVGEDVEAVGLEPRRQAVLRAVLERSGSDPSRSGRRPASRRRGRGRVAADEPASTAGASPGVAVAAAICAGTIVTSVTPTSTTLSPSRTPLTRRREDSLRRSAATAPSATRAAQAPSWSNGLTCAGRTRFATWPYMRRPITAGVTMRAARRASRKTSARAPKTIVVTAVTWRSRGRTSDELVSPRFCDHRKRMG